MKGDKRLPEYYRGITLLSSVLKLFTSMIANMIERYTEIAEEQQVLPKNRSTIDAIFIIRLVIKKPVEYAEPAFM